MASEELCLARGRKKTMWLLWLKDGPNQIFFFVAKFKKVDLAKFSGLVFCFTIQFDNPMVRLHLSLTQSSMNKIPFVKVQKRGVTLAIFMWY